MEHQFQLMFQQVSFIEKNSGYQDFIVLMIPFGALANFKVSDSMSIGYSYDYIVTDLNPFTIGSHELILTYELPFPKPSCKCKDLYN